MFAIYEMDDVYSRDPCVATFVSAAPFTSSLGS